jgi:hypothetical protein
LKDGKPSCPCLPYATGKGAKGIRLWHMVVSAVLSRSVLVYIPTLRTGLVEGLLQTVMARFCRSGVSLLRHKSPKGEFILAGESMKRPRRCCGNSDASLRRFLAVFTSLFSKAWYHEQALVSHRASFADSSVKRTLFRWLGIEDRVELLRPPCPTAALL